MRSRYTFVESDAVYFLTSTIVEWLPVFTSADFCNIITDSLTYCCKNKGLRLYAYVILDNHLHLIAEAPDLSATMQAFKGYTANQILALAKTTKRHWLLNQFEYYKKNHKTASRYQVWQEGVHPQLIEGDAMLKQKIDYVHENPVRRGLVDAAEDWRYSSARNYTRSGHVVLEIDEIPM